MPDFELVKNSFYLLEIQHQQTNQDEWYVGVILPLALPRAYTYTVPPEWVDQVRPGVRVEVQFGKQKNYAGIVTSVSNTPPAGQLRLKPILGVIDQQAIVSPQQLVFWQWLADYYGAHLGEVMQAGLPANFKLSSETLVRLNPTLQDNHLDLDDREYLIAEALTIQTELTLEQIKDIVQLKSVYGLIRRMLDKNIIYLQEDLKEKYKPKMVSCVQLQEPYASAPARLSEAFELLQRSSRQVSTLMAYLQLAREQGVVRRDQLYALAEVDAAILAALVKKGILANYKVEVSRLKRGLATAPELPPLSAAQQTALDSIRAQFAEKSVVLLQGVTGSGKTRIYLELIQETLKRGEQALYLLPEIALTTQLTNRLQEVLGDQVLIYHSRFNNHERIEIWNAVSGGHPVVLGARSALFLPFSKLKLIIVDEEHDSSYKQQDPAPRYQGRDAAIYLAQLAGAKVLLGSATPALETHYNAAVGKFGRVLLGERFGQLALPAIELVDLKRARSGGPKATLFSEPLLKALRETLEQGEQAILFQNRRGFAPIYRCGVCNWHSECLNCDVSLTYHKGHHELRCHYCGYHTQLPKTCPACGSMELSLQGFGTEKIEDELKIYFPEVNVARVDLDSVRSRHAFSQIMDDFALGQLQVLVGTQMVTKGLDFDNVGLVGVMNADQLLQFPDFRASERAFQLMVQVAGRAGRKKRQGKVLIQTYHPDHPVLLDVLRHDFTGFVQRELLERQRFAYPPYVRLIRITLKHRDADALHAAARAFDQQLRRSLGQRLQGPSAPPVGRVRSFYLLDFLIKMERKNGLAESIKQEIELASQLVRQELGFSTLRISIDVDPG